MTHEGGLRKLGLVRNYADQYPLISIITVVFNGEKTIARTIESVINQSYKNVEYIIIDGNSTDGTIRILQRYNKYIDYWLSEPDNGISDAFNKGIRLAKGEVIGIINADDWYEPNAFEIIMQHYTSKYAVMCGSCRIWYSQEKSIVKDSKDQKLKNRMSIYHPTCFIRSECYERFGLFNNEYKTSMDYDLLLRFKVNGAIFFCINRTIANFSLGGVSNRNKRKGAKESLRIKNRYLPYRKAINMMEYYFNILKISLV